jgi:hypothetical protein
MTALAQQVKERLEVGGRSKMLKAPVQKQKLGKQKAEMDQGVQDQTKR